MRTIPPTDLAKLSDEVCQGPYRAAFPSALPDRWIRAIARDLRQVELTMSDPSDPSIASMGGPVLLAIHIMVGRLRERQIDNPVTFSLRGLQRWLQVYQFAVERELVSRYTNIPIAGDDETLLTILDLEIDSLQDDASDDGTD